MYADLIARTCGFIGVWISLVILGFLDKPEFIVTPKQSFSALEVQVSMHELPKENAATAAKEEAPKTQAKPQEPKPAPAPIPKETQPQAESEAEPLVKTIKPHSEIKTEPKEIPAKEAPAKMNPPQETHPKESAIKESTIKDPPTKESPPKETAPKENPQKAPSPKENPTKAPPPPKKVAPPKVTPQKATASKADVKPKPQTKEVGDSQKDSNAKPDEQLTKQLNAQLSSLLVQEIKNKLKYPRNAVRRKLEGTVMVTFEIKNGVVSSFALSKSSGHKILDEAAMKLAQSLVGFNTRLRSTNKILIPIKYELI